MCFVEFIGYTCGHMSLPVLRPCPLTTARHTFPTCPRRADKPLLAGEMCSACQKIIHSRATQIEEYEHRFMHERGVCGCETVFPYLIRPRFIGGVDDDTRTTTRTTTTTPPILQESDVDGAHVVSVRLPSLFAAEWVADHRERHEAGLCECRLDFRTYQEAVQRLPVAFLEGVGGDGEPEKTQDEPAATEPRGDEDEDDEDDDEDEARGRQSGGATLPLLVGSDPRRTVSWSPPRWPRRLDGDDDADDAQSDTDQTVFHSCCASLEDQGTRSTSSVVPPNTPEDGHDHDHDHDTMNMNMDGPCDGGGVVLRMRLSGAVFEEVPAYLGITGPFLRPSNYAGEQHPLMDGVLVVEEELEEEEEEEEEPSPKPQRLQLEAIPEDPEDTETETDGSLSPVFNLGPNAAAHPATFPADKPGPVPSDKLEEPVPMGDDDSLFVPPWRLIPPLAGLPIGAGPEGTLHMVPWEEKPQCWRGHIG